MRGLSSLTNIAFLQFITLQSLYCITHTKGVCYLAVTAVGLDLAFCVNVWYVHGQPHGVVQIVQA